MRYLCLGAHSILARGFRVKSYGTGKKPSCLQGFPAPRLARSRWSSFGAGFGLEVRSLWSLVVIIPLFMPQKFEAVQHYWVTPIEVPVIQPWKPQPPPKPVVVKREVVKELPSPSP